MAGDRTSAAHQSPCLSVGTDNKHIAVPVGVVDKAVAGEPFQHNGLDGQVAGCGTKCGGERGRDLPSCVRGVFRASPCDGDVTPRWRECPDPDSVQDGTVVTGQHHRVAQGL
jgi:hypothetical protein